METRPKYDYPKCQRPPAPKLGTLQSVTMRYKDGNDEIEIEIDRDQAAEIGGVLWNEEFVKVVTGILGMKRRCRAPGQERPIKVVRLRRASSGEESTEREQELDINSGNCYYYQGMIICC
jgi:hypothetical protein